MASLTSPSRVRANTRTSAYGLLDENADEVQSSVPPMLKRLAHTGAGEKPKMFEKSVLQPGARLSVLNEDNDSYADDASGSAVGGGEGRGGSVAAVVVAAAADADAGAITNMMDAGGVGSDDAPLNPLFASPRANGSNATANANAKANTSADGMHGHEATGPVAAASPSSIAAVASAALSGTGITGSQPPVQSGDGAGMVTPPRRPGRFDSDPALVSARKKLEGGKITEGEYRQIASAHNRGHLYESLARGSGVMPNSAQHSDGSGSMAAEEGKEDDAPGVAIAKKKLANGQITEEEFGQVVKMQQQMDALAAEDDDVYINVM